MRSIACRYEECRSGVASIDHLSQRAYQLGKGRPFRRAARVEHDVPLRGEARAMQPEGFPEPALDSITDHRSAHGTRKGEPQPRANIGRRLRTRPAEGGEQRTGNAEALVIDETEFGGAQDPGRPGKRPQRIGRISWRWNSERLFRRSRSVCAGPARGAATVPPGRLCSSCAPGIRASWRACDY